MPDEVRGSLTWVDYRALCAHWQHEPPVEQVLAAYFNIPPRERPHVVTEAEVIADFTAAGFVCG